MSDASNRSWIRHLYVHGCEPYQIIERTRLSKIYVLHAIAAEVEKCPSTLADHLRNKRVCKPYSFARSHIVTGADQYIERRYTE